MQTYRVEFHCHTVYSKDSLTKPRDLVDSARQIGLDRLIVTDHNSMGGAFACKEIDPELVILGEEIMTTQGELLAFFMTEEIPHSLSPMEAIQRLREQGAFISVSHPFDRVRKGHWEEADLLAIVDLVDAIEVFNARCMHPAPNLEAQAFAGRHNLPGTAGSDAHAAFEVGKALMLIPPFTDADSLRQSLGKSEFDVRLSPPWVHFWSRYAKWRRQILGWHSE